MTGVQTCALPISGQQLVVNGQSLQPGETFSFNGSAETDGGRFLVYGGRDTDILVGGTGNDIFSFEEPRWNPTDMIAGGGGNDALVLSYGSGLNTITFGETQLTSIEAISVNNRFATDPLQTPSYALIMANGNVAAGATLIVNGQSLLAGQSISVNGSAETDGQYRMFGGGGNDVLTGGAGNDQLTGNGSGDTLTGGAGNDTFRYVLASDSNSTERDGIQDFNAGDIIDLAGIDANTLLDGDQAFSFVGNNAFTNTAGELRFENISLGGPIWLVQGDTNGDGVSDFEVVLVIPDAHTITTADFVF